MSLRETLGFGKTKVVAPTKDKKIEVRKPEFVDARPPGKRQILKIPVATARVAGPLTAKNTEIRYRMYHEVPVSSEQWVHLYFKDGLDHGYRHIVTWPGLVEMELKRGIDLKDNLVAKEALILTPISEIAKHLGKRGKGAPIPELPEPKEPPKEAKA